MKKLFLLLAFFASAFIQKSFSQDSTNRSQIAQLLPLYYNLKDALTASNLGKASSYAHDFVKAIEGINHELIPADQIKPLLQDAGNISNTKDLNRQREYFASLSSTMIAVVKSGAVSDKPVYVVHCPMKNASWLSQQKAIKNPYYGSSMLTCGEITDTIK